jgi:hypothetical protein
MKIREVKVSKTCTYSAYLKQRYNIHIVCKVALHSLFLWYHSKFTFLYIFGFFVCVHSYKLSLHQKTQNTDNFFAWEYLLLLRTFLFYRDILVCKVILCAWSVLAIQSYPRTFNLYIFKKTLKQYIKNIQDMKFSVPRVPS